MPLMAISSWASFGRPPLCTAEYANPLSAGVRRQVTEDLARAHREKLLWNVPFNGLGVAGAAGYPAVMERPAYGWASPGPLH